MEKKSFDLKNVTKINIDDAKRLLKEREVKRVSENKFFKR